MNKILILVVLTTVFTPVLSQNYQLKCPDGVIVTNINISDSFSFKVEYNHKTVIENCIIDLVVSPGPIFSDTPVVVSVDRNSVNELINPVVCEKSSKIFDEYNELIIHFKKNFSLIFRAYNNGIAYRFTSDFSDSLNIVSETFDINFKDGATAFFPEEESKISHYERMYIPVLLDTLTTENFCSLPTLVNSNDINILITEADLFDYPGMFLHGKKSNGFQASFANYVTEATPKNGSDRNQQLKTSHILASTKGKRSYPWRVMIISDNDSDLISSQLVYQLSRELEIDDPSWIKPGKVAWDWYNANNIYGVDFKAGINTDTYKYYIDFASRYGLEYIILDEGWSKSTTIIDEPSPDINIKELVAYGNSKNVGLILWILWEPLDKDMSVLSLYRSWAVAGIKVDFMQRNDQYMVNYYERVAKEAAKNKLIVDFHGAYKPSGLRRAYPNVLTYEGLKGNENNKWSSLITPEHNVTLPFIRMVAGPMDFTPGSMDNRNESQHIVSWNRPASMGTRCHQVAMYIVFESPLQMLCESPSTYYKENQTTEFISKIPTVWDETLVLDGNVADFVIIARRSGDTWYIGAMSDENARDVEIDLSFLDDGVCSIESMSDGHNCDRFAQDYLYETNEINKTEKLKVSLASGGGFAAIISKQK